MRIVCLSDTHSFNDRITVPLGDVLIHAGDLTDTGTPAQLFAAYAWLARQPHDRIIVTPGNHDFGLQTKPHLPQSLREKFPRVETLLDSGTTLGSMQVWGSPWQPWFHDWAFNFPKGPAGVEQARAKWDEIPDNTAILVTHGPPYGVRDATQRGALAGCPALKARIAHLASLRLHVFGHIHEAYGTQRGGEVLYVNACTCDLLYNPEQPPIVVDVDETSTRLALAPDI